MTEVRIGVYLDGPAKGRHWRITETVPHPVREYQGLPENVCLLDLPYEPSDMRHLRRMYRRVCEVRTLLDPMFAMDELGIGPDDFGHVMLITHGYAERAMHPLEQEALCQRATCEFLAGLRSSRMLVVKSTETREGCDAGH